MEYIVRYKKGMFWKNTKVRGHKLHPELDRMDLFLPDGSILSLAKWSKYDMKLGVDWVLATKKQMEKESGQTIPLNI